MNLRKTHQCPSVASRLNNQQDWLKLNGSSSSFLHFLLLLLCSWTLSVGAHLLLPPWDENWWYTVTPIFFVSISSDECRPLHLFVLLSIDSGSMALTRPHGVCEPIFMWSLKEAGALGAAVDFTSTTLSHYYFKLLLCCSFSDSH